MFDSRRYHRRISVLLPDHTAAVIREALRRALPALRREIKRDATTTEVPSDPACSPLLCRQAHQRFKDDVVTHWRGQEWTLKPREDRRLAGGEHRMTTPRLCGRGRVARVTYEPPCQLCEAPLV